MSIKNVIVNSTTAQRVVSAIALAVVILGVAFWSNVQLVRANADYICTRTIESAGECKNGNWGDWQLQSSVASQNGTMIDTYQRTYTGQRVLDTVIEYLNLRTACDPGFTQTQVGSGNGNSGFHGGKTYYEYQVCQIAESKEITRLPTQPPADPHTVTSEGEVTQTTTDVGDVVVGGSTDLTDYTQVTAAILEAEEQALLDQTEFTALPRLVKSGSTVKVSWKTQGAASCAVTGTNGDSWTELQSPLEGQTSGPITSKTTFTLVCLSEHGARATRNAVVSIIPTYQEK